MAMVNVIKSCLDSLAQISEHLEDATLYMDAGCTESFQFLGAFPLLLELGVRAVCSLENMSSYDTVVDWNSKHDPSRKIVVMTSCLLSDVHRYILRCLGMHQSAHHCTVFTSISEVAHTAYHESPLGPDAFHEYEFLLVQDYEELIKKRETKGRPAGEGNVQENEPLEDEGWSQLTSMEENISNLDASSSPGDSSRNSTQGRTEKVGQKLLVSVHHFPMMLCPLSPQVFVLPSEGSVAAAYLSSEHEDSLSPGLPPLSIGTCYGEEVPPGATLTAHFLYHLAAKMDLKLETFSVGALSRSVGKLMTGMSSLYNVGRRKRSAGLLLIDRTFDLLTPCCHGDSLVDRMFSSLPHRQRESSASYIKGSRAQARRSPPCVERPRLDIRVPLARILSEEDGSPLLQNVQAFLCGAKHNGARELQSDTGLLDGAFETPYLEAILDRGSKDGAVLVKKWLQEATGDMKAELQPMVKALARTQSSLMKHTGIILLAHALDGLKCGRWAAFSCAETLLNASVGDTSQNLAAQIVDLINKSSSAGGSQGRLSLQDALHLTIVGYILAGENFPTSGSGPFSWQEEHFLKEAVMDAILENPSAVKLKFLHGLTELLEENLKKTTNRGETGALVDDFDDDQWESWGDEDGEDGDMKEKTYSDMQLRLELRDRIDYVFKHFEKISSVKRGVFLKEVDPCSNKSLLHKLLTMILGKFDVPGLEYHSSTVGRLFKSGFGRFGLTQAKPSLADQDVIMVFVIGGINGLEVLEAREALSECGRPGVEFILGGTTFLTPDDMFDMLLGGLSFF